MTDLGSLTGPSGTSGINGSGQAVGWSTTANGYNRAFPLQQRQDDRTQRPQSADSDCLSIRKQSKCCQLRSSSFADLFKVE